MDGDGKKLVLVPSLDTSNFDNTILNYPLVLVRFYALSGVEVNEVEDELPLPSWVGVFPHFSEDEHDNFLEVAETFKWDFDFYRTNTHENIHVVKLFNSLKDNEHYEDTHNFDVNALVDFVKKNTSPLVTLCRFHPPLFVEKFFYT
ncbi:hypothetical protein ACFE04_009178 [Oxalis oulophora]